MLSATDIEKIQSYLFLGSPLDLEAADKYMQTLFSSIDSISVAADLGVSSLLEQIISSLVPGSSSSEIVIPLTAGLDSRGILGACLELYGPSRIRCFSYGNREHPDVKGASEVCAKNGVDWQNIDLNEIRWSVPEMIEIAQEVKSRTGAFCACGVVRRNHIESLFSSDSIILTGFFGGAISEDMVSTGNDKNAELVVRSFLQSNALDMKGLSISRGAVKSSLMAFVDKWRERVAQYAGLTCGDVLNFPFRQGMNIKGSVCYFRNSAAPYEDPRWIAFWANRSFDNRQNRTYYRTALHAEYPDVFCLDSDRPTSRGRNPLSFAKLKKATLQALRPERKDRIDFSKDMKGDIRVNVSMRETLSELCDSFCKRKIVACKELSGLVQSVISRPSRQTWQTIDRVSKAELHLRAGTLLPAERSISDASRAIQ